MKHHTLYIQTYNNKNPVSTSTFNLDQRYESVRKNNFKEGFKLDKLNKSHSAIRMCTFYNQSEHTSSEHSYC